MNQYTINDTYGYQKEYSYLDEVLQAAFEIEHVQNVLFSIIFVGNEEIQAINKKYRNIDRVTDVISFAFEDNEVEQEELRVLGDIYICIPKMMEQAKEYGHIEKRELSFLVVHGLLHLLGYDHMLGKEEEKEMFSKQDLILNQVGI